MVDIAFANAYGEQMTPNEMIQQLRHRVTELEKRTLHQAQQLAELNTQLQEHQHAQDDTN